MNDDLRNRCDETYEKGYSIIIPNRTYILQQRIKTDDGAIWIDIDYHGFDDPHYMIRYVKEKRPDLFENWRIVQKAVIVSWDELDD